MKRLSLGAWWPRDESVTGGGQREDAQGDEMGGGGDAMETRAGLGRIWAVCAAC